MKLNRLDCLNKAINAVSRSDYGKVENCFKKIALLWTAYLKGKYGAEFTVSQNDVAMMMVQLKIARLMFNPNHEDSLVDGAGYFACAAECEDENDSQCVAKTDTHSTIK